MPAFMPAALRQGTATPEDAIAAFLQRKLLEPSFRWQDVWQDEHARAFAVAGVLRLDVLQVFKDELDLTLREGRSLADFAKRIRPALAAKGFDGPVDVTDPDTGEQRTIEFTDARLRTIFDVNMRQSHAAGRWQRIQRDKKRRPLLMYRTMRDERVRASHAAWDGLVLPVDDPWWDTHYWPNGWRCRCDGTSMSEEDLQRRLANGEKLSTTAPPEQLVTYVNPRTGEVAAIPYGVDPGFAYNPGKQRDAALADQMLRKALKAQPLAGATAVAQAMQDHEPLQRALAADFARFVDQVRQAGKARGAMHLVGAMQPAAVRAVARTEVALDTATLAVRDRDVLGALHNQTLPAELYSRLPDLLAQARALVLRRGAQPVLMYVVDLARADGTVGKLLLRVDQAAPGKDGQALNVLRPVGEVAAAELADAKKYTVVWGAL